MTNRVTVEFKNASDASIFAKSVRNYGGVSIPLHGEVSAIVTLDTLDRLAAIEKNLEELANTLVQTASRTSDLESRIYGY